VGDRGRRRDFAAEKVRDTSLTGIRRTERDVSGDGLRGARINPPGHTHTHKRKTAIFNEKLKKASGMPLLILFLQYRARD